MITTLEDWIKQRIRESEDLLKEANTNYEDVLNNQDTAEYNENAENNNFEAGVISALKELQRDLSSNKIAK